MSDKMNIMLPQRCNTTAGHQRLDSHCRTHIADEIYHMAGGTKWQLAALLRMLKIDTVNVFYSRNDYLTVTVDNNTVLMYKNMSNKTNIMLPQRRTSYARTSEKKLTLLSSHT